MLANLTNLADFAQSALILGVVFGSVKGALLVRRAAVNRSKAGGANLKLCKLIKLNINRIVRIALARRLGLLSLFRISIGLIMIAEDCTYRLYNLAGSAIGNDAIGKTQSAIVVFVFARQLHGAE